MARSHEGWGGLTAPGMWWQYIEDDTPERLSCEVDDVHFVQPVGFIWFTKPRYRVKATSRKIDG